MMFTLIIYEVVLADFSTVVSTFPILISILLRDISHQILTIQTMTLASVDDFLPESVVTVVIAKWFLF